MELNVQIDRGAALGVFPFTKLFGGFESVGAVKAIFGDKTDELLSGLMVEVIDSRGYLRINDGVGSIMVNLKYLREGQEIHLYLDVIHELVHIRQLKEGKELWDKNYTYVDRPTEIEAYRVAVDEARRIGLTEEEVVDYLKVEWVSDEDFSRFLGTLGVRT